MGLRQKLLVICSRNIKDENLVLPHINLSHFESVLNWRNWNKFWRVCTGCCQTLIPNISIGNWNSEVIFGMRASFRILYKNMTSHPIISQILFLWHHHFRTLFSSSHHAEVFFLWKWHKILLAALSFSTITCQSGISPSNRRISRLLRLSAKESSCSRLSSLVSLAISKTFSTFH